jgi:putative two-component system response regulator
MSEQLLDSSLPLPDAPAAVPPSRDAAPSTPGAEQSGLDADGLRRSKIMIVDDEPYNVMVVRKYLRDDGYENLVTLTDSTQALKTIRQEAPSLLLLDISMPQVSGLDILRLLRADEQSQRIPVLILTARTDAATKKAALDLGATDFLPKPVDPNDLLPRVRNALLAKAYEDRLSGHARELQREVSHRTAQLAASREEIIHCLARAAEYRDDNTGYHVKRVGQYVAVIARALGLPEGQVSDLQLAAQLHDVGKIAIPDSILKFDGPLDPAMLAIMRKHCIIARDILSPDREDQWDIVRRHTQFGASLLEISSSPLMMLATRIALTHHEWWDGTGYPLGLAGEDIPIEGRVTAVADVFDALSTPRPYKSAIPRERCFAMMKEHRGTHFDPRVLDAFFGRSEEVVETQLRYADGV